MKPFGLKEALERFDDMPDSDGARTRFLKILALKAHRLCGGKTRLLPSVAQMNPEWLGVWYTPGVSSISTAIRDQEGESLELTMRGSTVAVISDSTRVLGDGDCTPPGGMGVMEGKALLMAWLGGLNAVPLCVNTRNQRGESDPGKLVEFVLAASPSFGAVNLEDISQPNCYRVLDELRRRSPIPVWHDDAQGTACVMLAGLLNALEVTGRTLSESRVVFLGAGAACSASARLLIEAGVQPGMISMFDGIGALVPGRADFQGEGFAWHRELCAITNPQGFSSIGEALGGADVLLAASAPGLVRREWISGMNPKPIVFACANPVPEIYPRIALEAGAAVVATGRSDLPNQVNNCLGFPGILKGVLLSGAKAITEGMAVAAAKAIAAEGRKGEFNPMNIMPEVNAPEVHASVAAEVAVQAWKEGLTPGPVNRDAVYRKTIESIRTVRDAHRAMVEAAVALEVPQAMVEEALSEALAGP